MSSNVFTVVAAVAVEFPLLVTSWVELNCVDWMDDDSFDRHNVMTAIVARLAERARFSQMDENTVGHLNALYDIICAMCKGNTVHRAIPYSKDRHLNVSIERVGSNRFTLVTSIHS
jgi:hypothetical protein